ncbi:MAG TPA: heme exporter protein CcmB [Rhizomicrobium sp.]
MISFAALVSRDLHIATRAGGSVLLAISFFAATTALFPLGIGINPSFLFRMAAGVVWVAAVFACLLSLDRLFEADYEDGSLDLLALGPLSLEGVALAKIVSHWLTSGLPLTLVSPLLALLFRLPQAASVALAISLLVGTPAVSAIGAIGAALTISVRRGGLILPLIVLPLLTPVVIFGTGAVLATLDGMSNGALPLLAAFSLASVLLAPFATAAALRLHLAA